MTSKRIIIFGHYFLPVVSGSTIAILETCARLPEFEWIVIPYFHNPGLPQEEQIGNIRVIRPGGEIKIIPKFFLKTILIWHCLAKLHHEKEIDGIYTTVLDPTLLAGLALFKLSRPKIVQVTALQANGIELLAAACRPPIAPLQRIALFLKITFGRIWLRIYFKRVNHIHAVSQYLARWARNYGYHGPISLIPNGVNAERFGQKSARKIGELRKQLGLENKKIIISVARLSKIKDLGSLIRGFYIFQKETGLLAKLLIVGDGEERKNLENIAKQLSVEQSVLFVGDIQRDQMPNYLGIGDIFVLPSLSEGFPIAVIEAMAAGIPIIVTPVGGIPEILVNGESGLYCQVENPRSIAAAIKLLLKHDELRKQIIENGKKSAASYDWNIIAEKARLMFLETL